MSTQQDQTPVVENRVYSDINLKDLLDLLKKDVLLSTNCHAIATIKSFNSSHQTVQATINYKKTIQQSDGNGNYFPQLVDYPILIDVPVIILSGGGGSLTFPISPGDTCLILFNDRDIDNWFTSGLTGPLNSVRLHSFADGIALIGLRSLTNSIANYDPSRVVLQNGTTQVGVGPNLVKISNNLYTLNSLLQELITEIKNLVTQTSAITVSGVLNGGSVSGVPVNAVAITAIGVSIAATADKIAGLLE